MGTVPNPFSQEVQRRRRERRPQRESRQTLRQIATDFGIAECCLRSWLRQADVEDWLKPGTTAADDASLREARKRIRLCA
jgi:hypothetical protein